MNFDIGYHVVSTDALDNIEEFNEQMSIVEFLRKVERQEELPDDIAVHGLDDLLHGAADPDSVGEYIHSILRNNVSFLSRNYYRVQFIVDDVEYWDEPVLTASDGRISLDSIFRGRLTQEGPGIFSSNLNLQS